MLGPASTLFDALAQTAPSYCLTEECYRGRRMRSLPAGKLSRMISPATSAHRGAGIADENDVVAAVAGIPHRGLDALVWMKRSALPLVLGA